jgi:hypothetical protein
LAAALWISCRGISQRSRRNRHIIESEMVVRWAWLEAGPDEHLRKHAFRCTELVVAYKNVLIL